MNPSDRRDIAESPLASELPDFDALDSDLDRAKEFICDAIAGYGKSLDGTPRTVFENNALKVFSQPFATALRAAQDGDTATDRQEFVAAILGEIHSAKDPYMALRCIPIVFNLADNGDQSQQDVATEFGVERATISAICIGMRDRLKVQPGRGMRADAIRKTYATRQRGRRAKPLPSPWPFRGLMTRIKSSLL